MNHQQVKTELDAIEQRDGTLKPEAVVEFAQNPETALHECFEWDDGIAAHQWRLQQARMLIRIMVTTLPNEQVQIKAFVSLKPDRHEGTGYRSIVTVLSNDDLRAQMLQDALDEMRTFRKKYRNLRELVGVFEAMERAERELSSSEETTATAS